VVICSIKKINTSRKNAIEQEIVIIIDNDNDKILKINHRVNKRCQLKILKLKMTTQVAELFDYIYGVKVYFNIGYYLCVDINYNYYFSPVDVHIMIKIV